MNKALTRFLLTVATIVLPYGAVSANACTCGPLPSPYKQYEEAKAVFVGRVINTRDLTVTEEDGGETYTYRERYFRFAVNESLKAIKGVEVEISVGRVESSCYQGFTVGKSYLVYAYGDSEKTLESGACTRRTELSYADSELYYLRALLRGAPEPRVYGSVIRIDNDVSKSNSSRATPMAGIKVVVEGAGHRFEAVTDKQGLYSLSRIPDGRYKARLVLPKKYFPAEEEFFLGLQEQLPDSYIQQGTSAYVDFEIVWNNSISGRILDSEGNPIFRAKTAVMLPRSSPSVVIEEDEAEHHDHGKYAFYGLTPGKYVISVKIRAPFRDSSKPSLFYYPGADNLVQATQITIGESESVEERDIRLPPEFVVRQIEGVLVWPNGVPVSGGWVCLEDSKDAQDDDNNDDCGRTNELGRFSLQAFAGAEYWVRGESNSSGKGDSIKVTVSKVNEPLKVVIPFPKPIEP